MNPREARALTLRRLGPLDAAGFQALRLEGLRESPSAFTASLEEEAALPASEIERRLAAWPGRHAFGVFEEGMLVAIARLDRDASAKQRHRVHIRGLYVAAAHRGKGAARMLLQHLLEFAAALDGVTHANLAVTAGNDAALKLYESLGFKAWGREPAALVIEGVAYDEIPMTKALTR